MNGEKVREWAEELDRLAVECEHLHELLTAQLGLFWTGDAYEACLRESKDNKEVVRQAIQDHRQMIVECSTPREPAPGLPLDFLL